MTASKYLPQPLCQLNRGDIFAKDGQAYIFGKIHSLVGAECWCINTHLYYLLDVDEKVMLLRRFNESVLWSEAMEMAKNGQPHQKDN